MASKQVELQQQMSTNVRSIAEAVKNSSWFQWTFANRGTVSFRKQKGALFFYGTDEHYEVAETLVETQMGGSAKLRIKCDRTLCTSLEITFD